MMKALFLSTLILLICACDKDPTPAQRQEAVSTLSCEDGNFSGCIALGYGMDDLKLRKAYFEKGCRGGNESSCRALWSSGTKAEKIRATTYGCNSGFLELCILKGREEMDMGDLLGAEVSFSKVCMGNDQRGCIWLGQLHENAGNLQAAAVAYKKGCDIDNGTGCVYLAFLEEKNGNVNEARDLFVRSCEGDVTDACTEAGEIFEIQNNLAEASKFYKKACEGYKSELGEWADYFDHRGCYYLGVLEYKKGNKSKGRKILNKACDSGNNEACHVLIDLK